MAGARISQKKFLRPLKVMISVITLWSFLFNVVAFGQVAGSLDGIQQPNPNSLNTKSINPNIAGPKRDRVSPLGTQEVVPLDTEAKSEELSTLEEIKDDLESGIPLIDINSGEEAQDSSYADVPETGDIQNTQPVQPVQDGKVEGDMGMPDGLISDLSSSLSASQGSGTTNTDLNDAANAYSDQAQDEGSVGQVEPNSGDVNASSTDPKSSKADDTSNQSPAVNPKAPVAGQENSDGEAENKQDDDILLRLLEQLKDPDPEVRKTAVRILGDAGDKRATIPLADVLLKDPDYFVRSEAAKALGNIGDARAIPPLLDVLGSDTFKDDLIPLCESEKALVKFGDAAVDGLIDMLKGTARVQSRAATVLGLIKNTKAVDPLISALKAVLKDEWSEDVFGPNPVPPYFIDALANIKDKRALPVFYELLFHGSPPYYVKGENFRVFGKDAVPYLIKAIEETNDYTLISFAIEALGKIGPDAKDAVPLLFEILQKGDSATFDAASKALVEIGKDLDRFLEIIIELAKSEDRNMATKAVGILAMLFSNAPEKLTEEYAMLLMGFIDNAEVERYLRIAFLSDNTKACLVSISEKANQALKNIQPGKTPNAIDFNIIIFALSSPKIDKDTKIDYLITAFNAISNMPDTLTRIYYINCVRFCILNFSEVERKEIEKNENAAKAIKFMNEKFTISEHPPDLQTQNDGKKTLTIWLYNPKDPECYEEIFKNGGFKKETISENVNKYTNTINGVAVTIYHEKSGNPEDYNGAVFQHINDPNVDGIFYDGHTGKLASLTFALEQAARANVIENGKKVIGILSCSSWTAYKLAVAQRFPFNPFIGTSGPSYPELSTLAFIKIVEGWANGLPWEQIGQNIKEAIKDYEHSKDMTFLMPTYDNAMQYLAQSHFVPMGTITLENRDTFERSPVENITISSIVSDKPEEVVTARYYFHWNEYLKEIGNKITAGGFRIQDEGHQSAILVEEDSGNYKISINAAYRNCSKDALRMMFLFEFNRYYSQKEGDFSVFDEARGLQFVADYAMHNHKEELFEYFLLNYGYTGQKAVTLQQILNTLEHSTLNNELNSQTNRIKALKELIKALGGDIDKLKFDIESMKKEGLVYLTEFELQEPSMYAAELKVLEDINAKILPVEICSATFEDTENTETDGIFNLHLNTNIIDGYTDDTYTIKIGTIDELLIENVDPQITYAEGDIFILGEYKGSYHVAKNDEDALTGDIDFIDFCGVNRNTACTIQQDYQPAGYMTALILKQLPGIASHLYENIVLAEVRLLDSASLEAVIAINDEQGTNYTLRFDRSGENLRLISCLNGETDLYANALKYMDGITFFTSYEHDPDSWWIDNDGNFVSAYSAFSGSQKVTVQVFVDSNGNARLNMEKDALERDWRLNRFVDYENYRKIIPETADIQNITFNTDGTYDIELELDFPLGHDYGGFFSIWESENSYYGPITERKRKVVYTLDASSGELKQAIYEPEMGYYGYVPIDAAAIKVIFDNMSEAEYMVSEIPGSGYYFKRETTLITPEQMVIVETATDPYSDSTTTCTKTICFNPETGYPEYLITVTEEGNFFYQKEITTYAENGNLKKRVLSAKACYVDSTFPSTMILLYNPENGRMVYARHESGMIGESTAWGAPISLISWIVYEYGLSDDGSKTLWYQNTTYDYVKKTISGTGRSYNGQYGGITIVGTIGAYEIIKDEEGRDDGIKLTKGSVTITIDGTTYKLKYEDGGTTATLPGKGKKYFSGTVQIGDILAYHDLNKRGIKDDIRESIANLFNCDLSDCSIGISFAWEDGVSGHDFWDMRADIEINGLTLTSSFNYRYWDNEPLELLSLKNGEIDLLENAKNWLGVKEGVIAEELRLASVNISGEEITFRFKSKDDVAMEITVYSRTGIPLEALSNASHYLQAASEDEFSNVFNRILTVFWKHFRETAGDANYASELDTNKNGQIDMDDYFAIYDALTEGRPDRYMDANDRIIVCNEVALRERATSPRIPITDPRYDANLDFNNDGLINSTDQILMRNVQTADDVQFIKVFGKIMTAVQQRLGLDASDQNFIWAFDTDRDGDIDMDDYNMIQGALGEGRSTDVLDAALSSVEPQADRGEFAEYDARKSNETEAEETANDPLFHGEMVGEPEEPTPFEL